MSLPLQTLAESPEQLQAQREADEAFNAAGQKYEENPELADKQTDAARESLWYGEFQESKEASEISLEDVIKTLNEFGLPEIADQVQKEQQKETNIPLEDIVKEVLLSSQLSYVKETDKELAMVLCFPHRHIIQWEFSEKSNPVQTVSDSVEDLSESPKDINEKPYSPLIDRLTDDHIVTAEVGLTIKQELEGETNFEQIIRANIPQTDIQQHIIDLWWALNSQEGAEKFQADFSDDFLSELSDFTNEDKDFTSERGEEAFSMIGSAYIIWESHDEASKRDALDTAFEMAANQAIDKKVFKRTESFEKNFEKVKNGDLDTSTRFAALIEVLNTVDNDQGFKGRSQKALLLKKQQLAKKIALQKEQEWQQASVNKEKTPEPFPEEVSSSEGEKSSWWDLWNFDLAMEVGNTNTGSTNEAA